ncbi:hypothetical protein RCL1_004179 [Eukaryota sp. TZLM3-RCL]
MNPSNLSQDFTEGCRLEAELGRRIVNQAKELKVKDLVYSSACAAGVDERVLHFHSKKLVEMELEKLRTGFRTVQVVRPVWFMENIQSPPFSETVEREKTLSLPLSPSTRLPVVSVRDVGSLLAEASLDPSLLDEHNHILEICSEKIAVNEMASALGLKYRQCEFEKFNESYQQMFHLYEENRVQPDIDFSHTVLSNILHFRTFAEKLREGKGSEPPCQEEHASGIGSSR